MSDPTVTPTPTNEQQDARERVRQSTNQTVTEIRAILRETVEREAHTMSRLVDLIVERDEARGQAHRMSDELATVVALADAATDDTGHGFVDVLDLRRALAGDTPETIPGLRRVGA